MSGLLKTRVVIRAFRTVDSDMLVSRPHSLRHVLGFLVYQPATHVSVEAESFRVLVGFFVLQTPASDETAQTSGRRTPRM